MAIDDEDAFFTTQLLEEFNTQQECHISVSSSSPSIQYVPSSPTPSVQEVASPLPLPFCVNAKGLHPPMLPGIAETILQIAKEGEDLNNTACAVVYSLITTIHCQTNITNQQLTEAHTHINRLKGIVTQHQNKI